MPPTPDRACDRARFEALYRLWYPRIVRLCRRWLGPAADAEAIAQEAFARAWLSWHRYTDDEPFGPWVATIARRLCINHATQARRRKRLAPVERLDEADPPVLEDEADALLSAGAVDDALRGLSARSRRLLLLHHVEGWSYRDLARFEGVTVEAVRGSLKRARSGFRRAYEDLSRVVLGGIAVVFRRRHPDSSRAAAFLWRPANVDTMAAALAAILLGAGAPAAVPGSPSPAAVPSASVATTPPGGDLAAERLGTASTPRSARDDAGAAAAADDGPRRADKETEAGGIVDYEFTVSPSYGDDHTVFAAGTEPCGLQCPVLLRSSDGGRSWARLAATGRGAGTILLPPSYPEDKRIFSVSPTAVTVSHDDGATFRQVAPVGGVGAVSPLFAGGDPRIYVAPGRNGAPLSWVYDDERGSVERFDPPLASGVPTRYWFGPDGRMFVNVLDVGWVPTGSLGPVLTTVNHLYSCGATACERMTQLTDRGSDPALTWSSGARRRVFAWSVFEINRSIDGGPFEPVPLPLSFGHLFALTATPEGRLFASMSTPRGAALFVSDDDGATWADLGVARVRRLASLPDGTLLAERWAGGNTLACSVDGGRTWQPTCSATPT